MSLPSAFVTPLPLEAHLTCKWPCCPPGLQSCKLLARVRSAKPRPCANSDMHVMWVLVHTADVLLLLLLLEGWPCCNHMLHPARSRLCGNELPSQDSPLTKQSKLPRWSPAAIAWVVHGPGAMSLQREDSCPAEKYLLKCRHETCGAASSALRKCVSLFAAEFRMPPLCTPVLVYPVIFRRLLWHRDVLTWALYTEAVRRIAQTEESIP
mmetsp:Transcript_118135/g.346028  ORF Transcript_118135/g.346028 Transcript_118135/m.346028 type:complete len:209 (+) Transcript_118135:1619-2245(+)